MYGSGWNIQVVVRKCQPITGMSRLRREASEPERLSPRISFAKYPAASGQLLEAGMEGEAGRGKEGLTGAERRVYTLYRLRFLGEVL